jgi:hypothetical protein
MYNNFKYNWNDQVKEDEVGKAYSTNVGEEEYIEDIGGKARRKENAMNTKDVGGYVILKWILG